MTKVTKSQCKLLWMQIDLRIERSMWKNFAVVVADIQSLHALNRVSNSITAIKCPINNSASKTKFRSFCCCRGRCRSPIKFFFSPLIGSSSSLQNSIAMNGTCALTKAQNISKITSNLCWKLETTATVGVRLRVRRTIFDYKAKWEKQQNVAHFNLLPFLY